MDLLNGELGSSDETGVTSTLVGNEVTGIEAERFSKISEVADQETQSIPPIKTEPNVQVASASLTCKWIQNISSDPSVITSETKSINDLPDEILLDILSYFGPAELCFVIAPVCERWNNLAKDVELWKTLSYTCDSDTNISVIKEVLTNAPALDTLIIRDRDEGVEDILKFLFDKRVDLKGLSVNCDWIVWEYDFCANLVDLYPDLDALSLEGCCSIEDESFGHITRLKKLSELYLYDCEELSGETVRLIADSCQNLKKLSLGGRSLILDEDVIHVIDRLGKQLTSFVLNPEFMTDVAYSYLKNCVRLQELEVGSCYFMTDTGLLEGIGSLQELTSLRLSDGRYLTAQAFSTFLHLPSMSSIVLLQLSDFPKLDDEGLKGIAERCIHLEELFISECCNVTDAGVNMVIRHCSQLRVLILRDITSITGEGWLTLLPSHLPHLKALCLRGCNVCDEYAKLWEQEEEETP